MISTNHVGLYQKGAALLLMLLALVVFLGSVIVFSSSEDAEILRIKQNEKTALVLADAKRAVLDHAIIDAVTDPPESTPRPGELPCPSIDKDGEANGGNACTLIGWLPWKTLERKELRDSDGYHLWYAVSDDFRDDGDNEPDINSAAVFNGLLRILNASGIETSTAAAVIISPGQALSGQVRSPSDNVASDVIQEYLEDTNSDSDEFFTNETTTSLNDQIIIVTAEELLERASELAIRQAAVNLEKYYDTEDFYPYPEFDTTCDINTYDNPGGHQNIAGLLPLTGDLNCPYPLLNMPVWFTDNNWDKVIVYTAAPACAGSDKTNCNGSGDFLTLDSQSGIHSMLIDSGHVLNDVECQGAPLYDQTRPWPTNFQLCEYLEMNENTNGDTVFTQPSFSATANDVFLIVNQ